MLQQSFQSGATTRIVGISWRQLDLWIRDGLISPSILEAGGKGHRRAFSFRDLVALKTINHLKGKGVPASGLKKIADRLKEYDANFADAFLVIDGDDVVLKRGEDLISLWKHPHQMVMVLVVSLETIENEIREAIAA